MIMMIMAVVISPGQYTVHAAVVLTKRCYYNVLLALYTHVFCDCNVIVI